MIDWLRKMGGVLALVAALGLSAFAPACAAPTLPLPPPTALVTAPDADGLVTVSGLARPDVMVFVINENAADPRDRGVIVDADETGAYSATIRGVPGDTITVFTREGTEDSQPTMRIVPAP